jgi:IclR family transcriptional regulator, KDG regulon repressor
MSKKDTSTAVASVVRVFGIIEELSKEQSLGLGELSQRLYMPKSTVFRFLQTMKELGYVSQDAESEKYALTVKLFQLSSHAFSLQDTNKVANNHMMTLAERTGETVHLAILDAPAGAIIYTHKVDSALSPALLSRVGKKAPLHCTALGKVLLAFSPEESAEHIIGEMTFRRYTPKTIATEEAFRKELQLIRQQGYAEDAGEHQEQIHCLAVPIFDQFGNVEAGMSITWPEYRYREEEKETSLQWMHEAAREISENLGYTGTYPS